VRSRRSIKLPPVQLPTAGIPSISWPNIPTPLKIGGLIAGNIAVDKLREMVERLFAGSADVEQTTLPTNFTIHHSSAAGNDSDVLHVQYNHAIIVGAAALGHIDETGSTPLFRRCSGMYIPSPYPQR